MLSKTVTSAVLLSALSLVQAQTFTDCDPTKKSCPADPALGTTLTTDFTQGKSSDWTELAGTTMTYKDGAQFVISTNTQAPTMELNKYIFFGSVSVIMKASTGSGIVSSFILESDDLDEIDWEWLGTKPDEVQSNFFGKGDVTTYDRGATHTGLGNAMTTYMNYTIDWDAESVKWYVGTPGSEGVLKRQLFYTDPLSKSGTRYPQTPMKVKMGSWIACVDANDPAKKGTCDWAGGQYAQAGSPYTMSVKSVTVQDYGCGAGSSYTYGDMTGSWQSIKPAGYCAGPKANSTPDNKPTTSSSSAGGVFAQSSTTSSSSTSSAAASSSTSSGTTSSSSKPVTTSTSATGSQTTLAQSTTSGATPTTSGSAATTSPSVPTQSANAAGTLKPKHQMGALDYGVMVLGLGLGYLFM